MGSQYTDFAAYYDSWATGVPGDVEFYVDQAKQAGSPILELGCGTGRILIPTAQAGIEVVGLDLSTAMLAEAGRKVARLDAETRGRIDLVEGDMRAFCLDRRFRLVTIPYRAFLHCLTPEDERQALLCVREHLDDGGLLVLNVFDPRLEIIAAHLGYLGRALNRQAEFTDLATGHRVVLWDSLRYDPERQTIEGYFVFDELGNAGQALGRKYCDFAIRYVYRQEMQYLLELCGFRVEALYGDFARGPFRHGGEQVWVARKR